MKLTKSLLEGLIREVIQEDRDDRMKFHRIKANDPKFLEQKDQILQQLRQVETWLDEIDCRRGHVRGLSKDYERLGGFQPPWRKMLSELARIINDRCLPYEEK